VASSQQPTVSQGANAMISLPALWLQAWHLCVLELSCTLQYQHDCVGIVAIDGQNVSLWFGCDLLGVGDLPIVSKYFGTGFELVNKG